MQFSLVRRELKGVPSGGNFCYEKVIINMMIGRRRHSTQRKERDKKSSYRNIQILIMQQNIKFLEKLPPFPDKSYETLKKPKIFIIGNKNI